MAALGVFGATLGFYVATLSSGPLGHDAGEFQFVPRVLGIPHPTGYPLYVLVGKLWSYLPVGSVAYRMNLLSAVFGAGGAATAYLLGYRLTGRALPALAGCLALAIAPLYWSWSVAAGIRSLAVLLMLAAVYLLWDWWSRGRSGESSAGSLMLAGLALGAGLANHRTAAFLLPPALLLLAGAGPRRLRLRHLLFFGSLLLLPLLTYLYLPLRAQANPPFDQFHPVGWRGFYNLAIAGGYFSEVFSLSMAVSSSRLAVLWRELASHFGLVGLVVAAIGCLWLVKRRPGAALLMLPPAACSSFSRWGGRTPGWRCLPHSQTSVGRG